MPLYAFGSNGSGQLGLAHTDDVSVPTRCLFDDDDDHTSSSSPSNTAATISRIAAGGNHTLVLFSDGRVYAAGWNEDGRCGGRVPPGNSGEEKEVVRFRRVFVDKFYGGNGGAVVKEEKFTDVSATWEATFLVSGRKVIDIEEEIGFRTTGAACGREFTVVVGDKAKGEFVVLGSPGDKWGVMSGVKKPVGGFQGIQTSWHGIYVHCSDGRVVSWGRNDRGQLPPEEMAVVKGLAVGSEHVLALVDEKTVVACGWGEHGNCGPVTDAQGNVKGVCSQVPLPDGVGDVVGLGAGCATSWVITRN
ncbi:hypothetical protein AbraIFM66950_000498 [Aspergillus brasiliensis]|nr:hypothetical protein AbraIFM66950_000498 [Aspergillus brasiliensis]